MSLQGFPKSLRTCRGDFPKSLQTWCKTWCRVSAMSLQTWRKVSANLVQQSLQTWCNFRRWDSCKFRMLVRTNFKFWGGRKRRCPSLCTGTPLSVWLVFGASQRCVSVWTTLRLSPQGVCFGIIFLTGTVVRLVGYVLNGGIFFFKLDSCFQVGARRESRPCDMANDLCLGGQVSAHQLAPPIFS